MLTISCNSTLSCSSSLLAKLYSTHSQLVVGTEHNRKGKDVRWDQGLGFFDIVNCQVCQLDSFEPSERKRILVHEVINIGRVLVQVLSGKHSVSYSTPPHPGAQQ